MKNTPETTSEGDKMEVITSEERALIKKLIAEEASKYLARPEVRSKIVAAAHKRFKAERKK